MMRKYLSAVCVLVAANLASAQGVPGTLRWGGDSSGGAPYIYNDPNSGNLAGFEVVLANELARRLKREPIFKRNSWDNLPQDLKRGDIDIVLNGYEWTPARAKDMGSSLPYYVAGLQLMVRADQTRDKSPTQDWKDLRQRRANGDKKKVGVLSESASERYLQREFKDDVEIISSSDEGTTGMMKQVQSGIIDATVQDELTAGYYAAEDFKDSLRIVGEKILPEKEGYYVIYTRKEDEALRKEIDDALRQMAKDGTLTSIYRKHGIWNEAQEKLLAWETWPPKEESESQESTIERGRWALGQQLELLLKGAVVTVVLAVLSFPLAVILGLAVAIGRLYGPRWLGLILTAYVEILRGTPLLLQLLIIYYVLPQAHILLPAFWAGVIGLAINYSAAEAENYRAGLLGVPRGQMEAALSLGMTQLTALRRVIVPQAVRIVIPPVTNDFIALFKDTSICSAITVTELAAGYRQLALSQPGDWLQIAALTALLYLLMSYPLSLLARRLEHKQQKVTA
jgi:polar amino acid transport system substrate-binding protein